MFTMKVTFFFTSTKVGFQLPNIGYVEEDYTRTHFAKNASKKFLELNYTLYISHLSKRKSDLKQKCPQLLLARFFIPRHMARSILLEVFENQFNRTL